MRRLVVVGFCVCVVWGVAFADTFGTGANQFTIDFVPISGDASSANGTNISPYWDRAFTDPGYAYRMGTYEITNQQWARFTAVYGVPYGFPTNAYSSNAYWSGAAVPTNRTSWYEAAQFVNWLNESTGHQAAYKFTGTKGTANYALTLWDTSEAWGGNNPYRHKDAYYFLPTEDEWVKAANWNGTGLQLYPNASAGDLIGGAPDPAKWNYYSSVGDEPWAVGSGVQELNGTYDMMGNVHEWMEGKCHIDDPDRVQATRVLRGGSYGNYASELSLATRYAYSPSNQAEGVGFRVASIPEPCTLVLILMGGVGLLRKRRR